jgi:hypothetical protein
MDFINIKMKSFVAITALAAYANAAATTFNNCLLEEGTLHLGACRSLWYSICDNYTILGGQTCNVETFGDASLNFYSDSIEVYVWNYVNKLIETPTDDDSAPDSETWGRLRQDGERECVAESLGNEFYLSEEKLQARNGACGYKFQVLNKAEIGEYDFTVLRAGSETLAATIIASAAILALF